MNKVEGEEQEYLDVNFFSFTKCMIFSWFGFYFMVLAFVLCLGIVFGGLSVLFGV